MQTVPDDPHARDVAARLAGHPERVARRWPPKSMHALNLDDLCAPHVTFLTTRDGNMRLGCAALLEL